MKIYTRTGDKGKTSLFDGTRVLKSHRRVETYGTIDSLNSAVGLAIAFLQESYTSSDPSTGSGKKSSSKHTRTIIDELEQIQHDLFAIGSAMAVPYSMPVVGITDSPAVFEGLIDIFTSKMPELKNFILPGGGKAGAQLHVCRTITRQAERQVVALLEHDEVDESVLVYLNRLSDLFFTLARFVNYQEKKKEIIWKKG